MIVVLLVGVVVMIMMTTYQIRIRVWLRVGGETPGQPISLLWPCLDELVPTIWRMIRMIGDCVSSI